MKFKQDKTGKLEKAVRYVIKKDKPHLNCLSFLCVWRDKEKLVEGRKVLAEVSRLSNKNRDVFGYDVMLEVDMNYWKEASREEKEKLIFHELEHIVVDYELKDDGSNDSDKDDNDDLEDSKTSQAIFEAMLADIEYIGEPRRDKQDRVVFWIIPHDISLNRFHSELLRYGLSPEEEALRLFLNHVKKNVGLTSQD